MAVTLDEYNRKRNFTKTNEPEGKPVKTEKKLKFVIQHHIARRDHYDFRLEWNGALLSWAVPKGPSYNTGDKRLAVQVEDHPLEYRNFEGTIPKGEYGGGTVMLWDEGYWEPYGDVDEGLAEGSLKFILKGKRLNGKWALVRMKAKKGEDNKNWLLLKEKDSYAKTSGGISEFYTSIRTGRNMDEIEKDIDKVTAAKNPFNKADVQLCKLVNTIPNGDDWLYELKYDGYRIMAYLEDGGVRLMSRNGNDYTKRFQSVASSLTDWSGKKSMVLDGEMVITDEKGKTDFQALQNYMRNPKGQKLVYIVFDLLALNGEDLRKQPLIDRKEKLEKLMKNSPENIYYSRHISGNGKENFLAACRSDLEGVVGKKACSVYSGTRNGDWIKLKCDNRQEFVIGGFTLTDKKTSGVSALLLGVYQGDDLIYTGRAGTGLTEQNMKELEKKFKSIIRKTSPFIQKPKAKTNEKITWLKPVYAAEIKFTEWTKEGLLRQASFKGLRTDKNPKEIKKENKKDDIQTKEILHKEVSPARKAKKVMKENGNIIIEGIKITNPDKILFDDSEITKEDVIRYYAQVSKRMLPYVENRILSLVRCPKGISDACFFKKHPGPDNKEIVKIPVKNSNGETEEYFYIQSAAGLVFEAQMGTLEFHIWGSRADRLEKPDVMVFDLDPDEGMDLTKIRQGVKDLKSLLDELSLISYLKTSGGKGYHVIVPLTPSAGWDTFYDFARHIAEVMEQRWPDRYTSNVRKEKRKNKIFVDWIRNGRGATSIAPYSIRARKDATVSMPISWKELNTVAPNGINMTEALKRSSRKDPWFDFFEIDQKLK